MDFKKQIKSVIKTNRKFFILILLLIPFSSFKEVTSENGISLIVDVSNLRNSKGVVHFALYNKKGSIPDENYTKYFKKQQALIKNGKSIIEFKNLPVGTYAINVFHDENQNNKIDKGLIFPKEGIGFSNFKSIGFTNIPSFEKASFKLEANKSITIKVIYM